MQRYQLAKLVEWAGTLDTRKRMQKVVYMLQAAGCPLDADFFLHRYGPYSQDVAQLTDEMVNQDLLAEVETSIGSGSKFEYHLPDSTREKIQAFEETPPGSSLLNSIMPFKERATKLLKADLKQLEFASTILFFQRQGCDWPTAVEKAVQFKRTEAVRTALPLAQSVA